VTANFRTTSHHVKACRVQSLLTASKNKNLHKLPLWVGEAVRHELIRFNFETQTVEADHVVLTTPTDWLLLYPSCTMVVMNDRAFKCVYRPV